MKAEVIKKKETSKDFNKRMVAYATALAKAKKTK